MIENFLKNSPFYSDCRVVTDFNEEMVYYSQPMQIHHLLDFLKDSGEFQILIDVCGVHYPANEKPFDQTQGKLNQYAVVKRSLFLNLQTDLL